MAGDTISFARGAPSADILPHEQVREAAQRALSSDWETALSYGVGIGHPGLCQWVAERHGHIDPAQVMVTNGSLEAGAMLFQHLLGPGDRVVVEQPTYDRTLLLLQQIRVELVPVSLEADGLDLGELEAALDDGPIKFAHVIPNAHNPAGCTLSVEKRRRLVELAAERDFWIFEDDPYRELPFEGEPLTTMLELDQADKVVHASSFSKTVSPGVRVGYLAGPTGEIEKLAKKANETYISPNMLAEAIVLELCRSGELDRNIEFVKGELKARCDALVSALQEQIPEAGFVVPDGGYFLWLDLAGGTDTAALLAEAKNHGVTFVAGPDFMIDGGRNSLRLSFAPVPADRAAEGVSRIASALENLRAGSSDSAHSCVLGRSRAEHATLPASLLCLVRRP
jgi:2-aminoadipate transaminase